LWKEVCRTLEVDLTGQTAAAFAMRTMYERTLLPFELHMEATQGTMVYPPLEVEEAAAGGQAAAAPTDMQTDERSAKRSRVEESAASMLP
jgi:hypothetical protein